MSGKLRVGLVVAGLVLIGAGLWSMDTSWTTRIRAQLGGADSQLILAHAYATGKGQEEDQRTAASWYLRAARGGEVRAQKVMGARYDQGLGVTADPAEATRWYRAAAEQGDAESQFRMAMRHSQGVGVARDKVKAAMWLILADRFVLQYTEGVDLRDALKAELSETELAEARRLASDWRRAHGAQS